MLSYCLFHICAHHHASSPLTGDISHHYPHHYQLCADGTCSDLTAGESCDPDATSPCECDALPFVCAKQIDLYPTCLTRFQMQYDTESECLAAQEDSLPQVDFAGPIFLACYIGLSAVTLVMLCWCAWNQRWASVSGSTVPLEGAKLKIMEEEDVARVSTTQRMRNGISSPANNEVERTWTQTGYTSTIIGISIYYLVVLAHLTIQFLLLALTVEYCELSSPIIITSNHNDKSIAQFICYCYSSLTHLSSLHCCFYFCFCTSSQRRPTRSHHHLPLWLTTILRRGTSINGI